MKLKDMPERVGEARSRARSARRAGGGAAHRGRAGEDAGSRRAGAQGLSYMDRDGVYVYIVAQPRSPRRPPRRGPDDTSRSTATPERSSMFRIAPSGGERRHIRSTELARRAAHGERVRPAVQNLRLRRSASSSPCCRRPASTSGGKSGRRGASARRMARPPARLWRRRSASNHVVKVGGFEAAGVIDETPATTFCAQSRFRHDRNHSRHECSRRRSDTRSARRRGSPTDGRASTTLAPHSASARTVADRIDRGRAPPRLGPSMPSDQCVRRRRRLRPHVPGRGRRRRRPGDLRHAHRRTRLRPTASDRA